MFSRIQNTFIGQVEDELELQITFSTIDSNNLEKGNPADELMAQELLARIDGLRKIIQSECTPEKGAAFLKKLEIIEKRCTFQPDPSANTDIEVRCALAFGHTLFIRGSGSGLNWDKGIPLTEKAEDIFVYRSAQRLASGTEYKFLHDDTTWEEGPNRKIIDGPLDARPPQFIVSKRS